MIPVSDYKDISPVRVRSDLPQFHIQGQWLGES